MSRPGLINRALKFCKTLNIIEAKWADDRMYDGIDMHYSDHWVGAQQSYRGTCIQ